MTFIPLSNVVNLISRLENLWFHWLEDDWPFFFNDSWRFHFDTQIVLYYKYQSPIQIRNVFSTLHWWEKYLHSSVMNWKGRILVSSSSREIVEQELIIWLRAAVSNQIWLTDLSWKCTQRLHSFLVRSPRRSLLCSQRIVGWENNEQRKFSLHIT